jgi:hypothetical protein
MLHGAIVPQQQIAGPPLVAVNERRLDDVIGERGGQPLGLLRLDAFMPVQSSRIT